MKITKLIVDNFKRLTAVTISPDGSTVVIGGANGAGKSSTLDAIEAALGGLKHAPQEPIRKGQKKARIVLETEELVVTRHFTAKDSTLEVKSKAKGAGIYPSPQALLDGLVGPISFDPLAFTRQEPKVQAETLRKLVGIDFGLLDKQRAEAFAKRTDVGRELKRVQGALDKLPEPPASTPDAEVSVVTLAGELDRRRAVNAANEAKRQALAELRTKRDAVAVEVTELEAKLAAAKKERDDLNARGPELRKEVDALVDADLDQVRKQIAGAEETNGNVRAKKQRTELETDFNTLTDESRVLTDTINGFDAQKAKAAAEAEYPIPGLAITDDGLTLDGVPFEQASSAQKLRASVAIGLKLNPKLKVLLIRDGSLLDAASLAAVAKMAEEADAQVWLERVSTGDEVTVVIEDGAVAEDREEKGDGRAPAMGIG